MKLVPADGNFELQQAFRNSYVRKIVEIFVQYRETLMLVADLLQTHLNREQPGLKEKLAGLHKYYRSVDGSGNIIVPAYISELISAIEHLYQQNNEKIKIQRGALVELLGYKLISPRYYGTRDVCSNSMRFYDEHNNPITIQEVDVVALSIERHQLEAYECKMKASGIMNDDCVDFEYLIEATDNYDYADNIGIISFDDDKVVEKRLKKLNALKRIKAYGVESLHDLQQSPFEEP